MPQVKEIPCDLKALVSDDEPADEDMAAMFMSLVGALAWLVLTIPAICVYVAYLQRHTKAPTLGHVRRGNRLLRWIRRNKTRLGVWFRKLQGPLRPGVRAAVHRLPSRQARRCDARCWTGTPANIRG